MTPRERAEDAFKKTTASLFEEGHEDGDRYVVDVAIEKIEEAIIAAVADEREACAKIADVIRKRELIKYTAFDPSCTIAEEIRDRIQMRPSTNNADWSELKPSDS